jgi:hypothetical protein
VLIHFDNRLKIATRNAHSCLCRGALVGGKHPISREPLLALQVHDAVLANGAPNSGLGAVGCNSQTSRPRLPAMAVARQRSFSVLFSRIGRNAL